MQIGQLTVSASGSGTPSIGVVVGDIHMARPAATRVGLDEYLAKVREIAPGELKDRHRDIDAMTAFCDGPEAYLWWQADAYAGKSALLSWFALHPPEGVDVVSFFITARDASQADSMAFEAAVAGQLEDLLAPDLPGGTEGEHWLRLLEKAARRPQTEEENKRLVLVVDGLDEDLWQPARLPSIASRLPKHCGPGLKVIVSSRPHPGIPPDVAPDHPLRGAAVVRALSRSKHALVIRDAFEWELRSYHNGSTERQLLLGLLAAAQGGLTLTDLAELTPLVPFQLRPMLTSRIFTTRAASWIGPDDADREFLLAHEELRAGAAEGLGKERVDACRDQIHAWAAKYRSQGWPPGTSAYLLRGYFPMLKATGDTARLIAWATDETRHDRMLAVSGGDAIALTEIDMAMGAILDQPDPDLATMAFLAVHRTELGSRNAWVPTALPAVWAALGQAGRAEALACSIPGSDDGPVERALALAAVARELAAVGLREQARRVAGDAEAAARAIIDPDRQVVPLARVARALAAAGLKQRAALVAGDADDTERAITRMIHPHLTWTARSEVAQSLAAVGEHDRGGEAAAHLGYACYEAEALAGVAQALTAAGLAERARQVVADAETAGRQITRPAYWARLESYPYDATYHASLTHPYRQAEVLTAVAEALAAAGLSRRSGQAAADAETAARTITDEDYWQISALASAARGLAAAGLLEQALRVATDAETAAREVTDQEKRASALTDVARALLAAGRRRRAVRVATDAEAAARAMTPGLRDWALAPVACALAAAGLHDRAVTTARALTHPNGRARALTAAAEALAAAGLRDRAAPVAVEAETSARAITDPGQRNYALTKAAPALAAAGLRDQAEAAARTITYPYERLDALARMASALAAAGLRSQAVQAADEAEVTARTITDLSGSAPALIRAVEALAAAGLRDRASHVADNAVTAALEAARTWGETWALVQVAQAQAAAGLPDQAEATVRVITDFDRRAQMLLPVMNPTYIARYTQAQVSSRRVPTLTGVARALATAGLHERAERMATDAENAAQSVTNPEERASMLAGVVQAVAAAGQPERAVQAACDAEIATRAITVQGNWLVLTEVARALAAAGLRDRAARVAGDAETAAKAILFPDERAEALSCVAQALADAGRTVWARQLIAQALATSSATSLEMASLQALVLAPQALEALSAMLVDGELPLAGSQASEAVAT